MKTIKATVILGSEAVRHYEKTARLPGEEDFGDTGCRVIEKTFMSEELYRAYIDGLEDSEGADDYRVVDQKEIENTDLDARVIDYLRSGPTAVLYIGEAIGLLQQQVSRMSDEELHERFERLIQPRRIRNGVLEGYNRLNGYPPDRPYSDNP